uniref:Uncharacterized protein n=1 Tax=Panagrolaimus davidi TaxID=227884 RepID=A0A914P7E7_9BILA
MFLTEQKTNEATGRFYKTALILKKPQDNISNFCATVNVTSFVIMNMDQFRDCAKVVKRLEVFPSYGNRQNIFIGISDLTEDEALTTTLELWKRSVLLNTFFDVMALHYDTLILDVSYQNLEVNSCYRSFSVGVTAFMQNAVMNILEEPLKIPAHVLKAPQAKYANGSIYPEQNDKWRLPELAKYAITGTLKR